MAKAITKPTLDVRVTIEIDEQEARSLDALAGYGVESFLKVFYEHMGRHYLEPHEEGLRRFLGTILATVGPAIRDIDEARRLLSAKKDASKKETAS